MAWRIAIGLFLAAVVAVAAVVWIAAARWERRSAALRSRLEAGRDSQDPGVFDPRTLGELPDPVRRYLRTALRPGQRIPTASRLTQRGTFSLGEEVPRWSAFVATQRVIARRPGFVWEARIALGPARFGHLLVARVHDAYALGEGQVHAEIFGWTLAEVRGTPEVALGELQRFLAEAPWMPTLLLPRPGGVRWEAIDAASARATLEDGPTVATLDFHFGADGLVDTVTAAARYRSVGGRQVATPWQGRFWGYEERAGTKIPLDGEVAWLLPTGALPYWRGHLESVAYDVAQVSD